MPFKKANKHAKGGKREGAGRKPNPIKEIVQSGDYSTDPTAQSILDRWRDIAITGEDDRVAIMAGDAWFNRKYGKPQERKEVDVNANVLLVDDLT